MRYGSYDDPSVALAVDLINAFGDEAADDPRALRALLGDHQVSTTRAVTTDEVATVRAVSRRLEAVLRARSMPAAAEALNALLVETEVRPHLTAHGGDPWHLHYTSTDAPLPARLAVEAAMGLAYVMRDDGLSRFRSCAAATCTDVFVDASRNRSRRFCSPACSNRSNVAAYRRRQRDGASSRS